MAGASILVVVGEGVLCSMVNGQWSMVNGQPISGVVSLKHLFGRLALVDVKSHVQRARLLSA
jgi:hypothetical protein